VILAQISNEEKKLTAHMVFARKMAGLMDMHHENYKLIPDDR